MEMINNEKFQKKHIPYFQILNMIQ